MLVPRQHLRLAGRDEHPVLVAALAVHDDDAARVLRLVDPLDDLP
jgi:hypothetical protein